MVSEGASSQRGRLPSLDGLRAVSIVLVLSGHIQLTVPPFLHPFHGPWLYLANADLGVSTFFVISGFLITTLLLQERSRYGAISLRSFYIRRFFRIVPPFYSYLIAVSILASVGLLTLNRHDLAISGLFITDYIKGGSWWVGHSWSLSVEEQFYLLWPAALVAAGARRARALSIAAVGLGPAIRLTSHVADHYWGHYGPLRMFEFHNRFDNLAIGCLLALAFNEPWILKLRQRLQHPAAPFLALAVLFGASPWLRLHFIGLYQVPFGYSVDALAITALLIIALDAPSGWMGKALNWSPIVHIGVLSYSLYLWQELFLAPSGWGIASRFPGNLVAAFIAAEISYWTIERLALRIRRRFGTEIVRLPKAAQATTAA